MKTKLTSRKFWMALATLIVGVLALFKVDANMTTQISGVVMSLGAVVAYIVGEGLVDAAAVGANSKSASIQATTPDNTPVVDKVDPTAAEGTPTGAVQAAETKQETALSDQSAPTAENIAKAMINALQTAQSTAAGNTPTTSPASGSNA